MTNERVTKINKTKNFSEFIDWIGIKIILRWYPWWRILEFGKREGEESSEMQCSIHSFT